MFYLFTYPIIYVSSGNWSYECTSQYLYRISTGLNIITVVSINEVFNRCIFQSIQFFNRSRFSIDPVFQSIQFFNRSIFSIDPFFQSIHFSIDPFFLSIHFFNRSIFSIDPFFQSIHFFNRSIFSIDPVFQSIRFFNRSSFSIDADFQSMHCSIDAVFCKAIFQSMYRLKIYW